jgi:RecB family exonuclease
LGPITLLLGKTRARRARALLEEQLADVDPSHLLWVCADEESADRAEAMLAERRVAFAPEVCSLEGLLLGLWAQLDGRPLLGERAQAVVAEQVVVEEVDALRRLGGSPLVGEALARVYTQHVEAGRPPLEDFPRADVLRDALRRYERRLAAAEGLHPSLALEATLPRLEAPEPPLRRWLVRSRAVIFDELVQPSPLRRALVITLTRLWAAAGVRVVLTFESGRDLGGAEAGLFFEYDDVKAVDYSLRPFSLTRPFRRDLFTSLVSAGQADILVARADGTVLVDPLTEPRDLEPGDLSDHVHERGPLPCASEDEARAWLGGTLGLTGCPDIESELRFIAASVKQALLAGVAPTDCAVTLAGLTDYAPQVRSVFADYGVPIQLSSALPLARTPGAILLRELPRLALDGFPADRLLPVMDSGLLSLPEGFDAAELARWCRAAGLSDEPPRRWKGALFTWLRRTHQADPGALDVALHHAMGFCAGLEALAEDAAPRVWRDRLVGALEGLGVPARLGRCPTDPALAFENLRAWGAAVATLDELTDELERYRPGPWPAERLAAHLERALEEATWRPDPRAGAGVPVVDALELRGPMARRTWLGGLSRAAFLRQHRSAAFLLPRRVERTLEGVDPVAEARYRFSSLLRNAMADPEVERLELSWPAVREGRGLPPSPVLQELLSLPTTHPDGRLFGELAARTRRRGDGERWSRSDALRAAAVDPGAWSELLPPALAARAALQREVHLQRTGDRFGVYDGALSRPPPPPESLAVTALEAYLRCPARYWYRRVLGLRSPAVWDPELAPDRRGTAFHRILQEFMERWGMQSLEGEPDREGAARLLHDLACVVLDEVADEGGADETLLAHLREVWLSGLVDASPAGTLKVWLEQEIESELGLEPEAVESSLDPLLLGGVSLKGTLDRLDRVRLEDGELALVVTDYKTGYAPSIHQVTRGLALQSVAYAEFAVQAYGDLPVASVYYVLRRPDELARRSWCGDPRVLERLLDPRQRRFALALDRAGRRRLMDHAADGVRRMIEGRFHPTLAEPEDAGCEHCDYRRICRLDVARGRRVQGDWQRPLEPEEEAP